jgi:hypothetical protein
MNIRKFLISNVVFGLSMLAAGTAMAAETNVSVKINGRTVTAHLADNPVSRELVERLPQTFKVDDYNGIEKTGKIARRLGTDGVPAGYAPKAGDIVYYAPWGNLVFFYKDLRYYDGLIYLGHMEGSLEALAIPGETSISISLPVSR